MTPEELKAEFEQKGFVTIDSFHHDGHEYVLYRINANNTLSFVTGDRYSWVIGLRYDTTLRIIVRDYLIEDELRTKIEYALRNN